MTMKRTDKDIRAGLKSQEERKERAKMKGVYFPHCIGKFPECKEYTEEMDLCDRTECKSCPYQKKGN